MHDAFGRAGRPSDGKILADELKHAAGMRPRGGDWRSWKLIADALANHKLQLAFTLSCMLLASGSQLFLTWALRYMVDVGLPGRVPEAMHSATALVAAAVAGFAVFSALRVYFSEGLGIRVVTHLRQRVFRRVLELDSSFYLRIPPSEVISRMTADMTIVEVVTGNAAHVALRSLVILIGCLLVLVTVNPYFALWMLVALAAAMLPLVFFAGHVRRLSRIAQDRFAEAMVPVSEALGALETVQAFGREGTAQEHFAGSSHDALRAAMHRIRAKATSNGLLILLTLGGLLFLFLAGVSSPGSGGDSYGTLTQMLLLSFMAGAAVRDFGNVWGDVQRAAGALDRIGELLAAQPTITAPARPKPIPADGEIRFEHVSFAYPSRSEISALKDFSLHVRRGERVALVGTSGAGKSTVLRMLLRFYDPDAGSITIGGTDLRDADPGELRKLFAVVDQDSALFSWSVRENIGYGQIGADDPAIRRAAEAAQAADFIAALPQGMETPLGTRGSTLSGGQRQRVAIARALVRDAPFLLLDEATSALDAENERLIQDALERAMAGRTTLVIAHRLATVKEADRLVVMDEGRIVEEGTHDGLMARNGFYARVARLQFRD